MHSDVDVEEVTVQVQNGRVTLEGSVPQRHMKHRIEDIADQCSGVQDVDNRVRVQRESSQSGGQQQGLMGSASNASSNTAWEQAGASSGSGTGGRSSAASERSEKSSDKK